MAVEFHLPNLLSGVSFDGERFLMVQPTGSGRGTASELFVGNQLVRRVENVSFPTTLDN